MLCEGVMLYMKLVTVLGNRLNRRCFFFLLGWGKPILTDYFFRCALKFLNAHVLLIGPAIPIVAISVGVAHEHYGTEH